MTCRSCDLKIACIQRQGTTLNDENVSKKICWEVGMWERAWCRGMKHIWKSQSIHSISGVFLVFYMRIKHRPHFCGAKHIFDSKWPKYFSFVRSQERTDVHNVNAVVLRRTQNENHNDTSFLENIANVNDWKNVRRCGAKHILTNNLNIYKVWLCLEVAMLKSARRWGAKHKIKNVKKRVVRTSFGNWNVEKTACHSDMKHILSKRKLKLLTNEIFFWSWNSKLNKQVVLVGSISRK